MTILQTATPLGLAAIVAKETLLIGIGWCGTLLLRRAPAVARHLVWLTVIVGVLLIPVLASVAPMNVPVLPSIASAPAAPSSRDIRSGAVREPAIATTVDAPSATIPRSPAATRSPRVPSYAALAVALWLSVTLALFGWLLSGMLSVGRIIRRGRPLRSAEWTRALAEATNRLSLTVPPRLVMSDQVEMAFAFDAFAPTIIVPVSANEWSDDRRRAVLLHELAHIRRRDLIGHTIASIACAVYWFNPFVWAAARRLRVESELASDDVVLESGVRPSDYAQHLLDMVTSFGQRTPTAALAMARPKEFEGRLVAILDRANHRHVLGKPQGVAMVALLGLLTVSVAAVVPVPRTQRTHAVIESVAVLPTKSSPLPPRDLSSVTRALSTASSARAKDTSSRPEGAAPSDVAIATLLRFGTASIVNPMMMILRNADSLGLTGRQADSIATLNRWYMVRLNTIWSPVSSYYVSHPEARYATGPNAATVTFGRASRASMDALIEIAPNITRLLTADQRRTLTAPISTYLDSHNLAALGAGQTSAPGGGGVFLPNGGYYGAPGARGGGRVGR